MKYYIGTQKLTKKELYSKDLYLYGVSTLLYLINYYESLEKYEECQIIMDVIHNENKERKNNLPTKFDKNTKVLIKKFLEDLNLESSNYFLRIPHYAKEIIKFVKEEK